MKRVSRACQQCRSKHIKCNGRSPCSRCIAHAELHNITPNEICLYPEPKKRGRPSAGSSHHHSTSSSSVGKKKVNTIINKGRPASNPTVSSSSQAASSSTTTISHPQVQQQKNWQKSSSGINASNDSYVYMNCIDIPYLQQVSLNQMPVSIADICSQQIINNNLGFTFNNNHQQQQPQQQLSRTILNSNNNRQHPIGTIPSTITISSSSNNRDISTLSGYLRHRPYNYNNYNNNNNNNIDCISNNITPQIIVANSNTLIDPMYSNNLKNMNYINNEGNISDSSDSPYSSLTSTPELVPWNITPPSIANSPILPPSAVTTEFPTATTYYFSTASSNNNNCINNNNSNNNNGGFSFNGFPCLNLQDNSGFDSPLLPDKSELAYIPFTTGIYPSMLDRNTAYVKSEDRFYDSQAVNTAGWFF